MQKEMQNMWNTMNNNLLLMGNNKQLFGPNTTQKRQFGCTFPSVGNIGVGKSFNNPNFVNKGNPKIHNYQSGCHIDSNSTANKIPSDAPYINSSRSIFETIKEKHFDVFQPVSNTHHLIPSEDKPEICKKRTRKSKIRSRKDKPLKNLEKCVKTKNQEINEMMEIAYEPEIHSQDTEISMSPKEHNFLTLSDFLGNKNSIEIEADINMDEDVEADSFAVISNSTMHCRIKRERTLSTTESEDSFIVFESGTDDELEFSDNTQDEDESEDESEGDTDEDELDYSPPVVPRKKVRFADDSELCQIHPMIMWSYAYQKARIGHWQQYAVDRVRFKDRIKALEEKLKPVLDSQHRERVFNERFQNLDPSVG